MFYIILSALSASSQTDPSPFQVWRLMHYSGEARLRGTYRAYTTTRDNYQSSQTDMYLNGLFHINTKSYFVHPNFMLVDFNATLNPMTRKDSYIGAPDYSEKYASEGLDCTALFFNKKKIHVTANAILNRAILNIENITKVESKTKQYGATASYTGRFLPVTIGYTQLNLEQNTIGSDDKFVLDQRIWQANASKSFTEYDENSVSYLHTENKSAQTNSVPILQTFYNENTIDLLELTDNISFDKEKKYAFSSYISNSNERGTLYYKRLYANESLNLKLPYKFVLFNNYNYGTTQFEENKITTHATQSALSHQLYESLHTKVFFDHLQVNQAAYDEYRNKIGIDLMYDKKIPKGKLLLYYNYFREYIDIISASSTLRVVHAEYILIDNQITLLKNQNIDMQSVVVKDNTGNLVYRLNVDYILIDRNPYVEIVRIPGGLIANNTTVYIDYNAEQAGTYSYYMNSRSFTADLMLFKNKLDLYFRSYYQDYNDVTLKDNLSLNYLRRHIIGTRVDFNYLKAGVEFDDYNSNILPYRALNYFINLQKSFKQVSFTLNSNLHNIYMIDEDEYREDFDISCKVAYSVLKNTKIDFDYTYRSMKGKYVNMELTTTKVEITSTINKLFVSLGGELYWNKDRTTTVHFKGVYVQLTRNF